MAVDDDVNKCWKDKKIRKLVEDANSAPDREGIKDIRKMLDDIDSLRGDGRPISNFFEAVGSGVVVAQRQLDDQSHKYNEGRPLTENDPGRERPEMPTLFRIPRVNAEIQFGVSSLTSNGFNIIIAQSKTEREERTQQKVSFEVVSAPPPPKTERVRSAAERAFSDILVTNPAAHGALVGAIQSLVGNADKAWLKEVANQVLILRGDQGYLAVIVEPKEGRPDEPAAIYLYALNHENKFASPPTQMKATTNSPLSPAAKQMGTFLLSIARAQAAFLGAVGNG